MVNPLRTIKQIAWKPGIRVLIRIDGDVAINKRRISDDFRLIKALPSIKEALRHHARIRIISHRGRPHGSPVVSLTQRPVALYISKLLKKNVIFIKDPFDEDTFKKRDSSKDILFFENIRFWKGDEENSTLFARKLARWADIFINDAFANAHRNHASVVALAHELPSYAGINFEKEVTTLERVLTNPTRPLVAVLGGAKLETKIPLIKQFLTIADYVLIGGAIANTLLVAKGYNVGKSLVDPKRRDIANMLLNKKLYLPCDVITTQDLSRPSSVRLCDIDDVAANEYIVDIGKKTIKQFSSILAKSGMVVWNGPVGFAEVSAFAQGTVELAKTIRRMHAFKIIGGGDTIALLRMYHALRGFTYISTGGGAMLELLGGKKLSSIEILRK